MKNKKNKQVIIGGTFEFLHKGHKAFLKKAFQLGETTLGLTSDKMAEKTKKRKVKSFVARKKALAEFIKKELKENCKIIKIEDKFGPTLSNDFDYIVVSPQTYQTAWLINKERKRMGRKPIKIAKIKFILAENGKPVSSTQIKKREMDRGGRNVKMA